MLPTITSSIENQPPAHFRRLVEKAEYYSSQSHAPSTVKAYDNVRLSFLKWCGRYDTDPLKVGNREGLVAFYVSERADELKPATLEKHVAGIHFFFSQHGLAFDTKNAKLAKAMKGIRRLKRERQDRKEPVLVEDLQAMVTALPESTIGIRDRAILLFGFAGGFRRSELVALRLEDIKETRDGYLVLVRRSKTDQYGEGMEKAIPYGSNPDTCPARALKDWLIASTVTSGYLFRSINRHGQLGEQLSDKAIANIIKRNPHLAGKRENYSGHSLRAGLCTEAAKAEVPDHVIMAQTGHKSRNTLQVYIRRGTQFKQNAAARVGL